MSKPRTYCEEIAEASGSEFYQPPGRPKDKAPYALLRQETKRMGPWLELHH